MIIFFLQFFQKIRVAVQGTDLPKKSLSSAATAYLFYQKVSVNFKQFVSV